MEVDTIAAVSTAPGVGAIAVVRVSGVGAPSVLMRIAPKLRQMPEPRRASVVELRDPRDGSRLDRALVTFFRGPASYTGEDLLELSCHGGWLGPELVLEACVAAGARRAEPGEFTKRAYLHGKVDLVQAEAISELVAARSVAGRRAALGQLDRGLSARIARLRSAVVGLEAALAHHIDFPEEDDAPVTIGEIAGDAEAILAQLDAMLATAPEGELLREGALAVLAGRPNVGKSSLYNSLIGEERAIVTEEPGTTRDALVASVVMGGFPFRLVDTAGLRTSEDRVEQLGVEVTRRYLKSADVVLLCSPAEEGLGEAESVFLDGVEGVPVVWVETKTDRVERSTAGGEAPVEAAVGEVAGRVRTSVKTGEGLDRLRDVVTSLVYSGVVAAGSEVPVITQRRQRDGLAAARDEIAAFVESVLAGAPAEVAATHLRTAEGALEEIVGSVSVDAVLDAVFSRFCVGK